MGGSHRWQSVSEWLSRRRGDHSDMRFALVAVVVSACALVAAADVAHLKTRPRWAGRLAGRHHKRGVLSHVPPFKLGYDIPQVTHSVVKPLVVTYPPAAAIAAVKVPLAHPLHHYPVPVGHRVPVPHPHYGLKFPHHKAYGYKPDQHFHHHHHHVAPRPVVPLIPPAPVPATPVVPIAQPSGTVVHPIPAPSPPVFIQHAPVLPSPVDPPPFHAFPPHHTHLSPVLPAPPAPVLPAPVVPAPVYPVAPQYPYVIRPGNAIQSSLFATYPRYPFLNYPQLFPLTAPAVAPTGQVYLEHSQVPHFHLAGHGVVQQPVPTVAVEPTPAVLHPTQAATPHIHLQPTQPVPLEHDGWAPVPSQPHDLPPTHTHTEPHFPQPHEGHFTQEQGTQVFEQHTAEQFHEYQHQLNNIQHQIDQAQYEQHLHNHHQLNQEYGPPQPNQEYGQLNQEFSQHNQEYAQHGQGYEQHGQERLLHQQQLGQEYGLPHQEGEGRSIEAEVDSQRYHNHIPLGLQPPIDRPLDQFR